ncbi:hypothetical protein SPRG_01674 [Saprolegnia parasitica CBS 223.65]|uniref:Uncharacterized protein n=1 Tax=Saprolegnia parasitica (strain CBS 223.65) TaxID=695850 RepID=A0A067CX22_SAPPC|nr:hypothetical protein SPRG_01674 [Saprolegnia parasitica CBS 223.65]KDO33795.1 hypothetical protein SPRG_01674 [Saprolegnia parasitica CBS 223.65]|eukprot:XP_012195431.1 hypothetical protein SPRG_01674 [Saprolegnia parasitica CBS 223.65]
MAINGDQLANGIVGGHVVESDCTKLRTLNVLDHRDDDGQHLLCGNSCFNATAATYAAMLNNDCFHGDDEYEVANQRLYAASFQFACQAYAASKYCVSLLGDTVASAGGSYDLCKDIVKPLECCYESYRRYMLFGTNTSVAEMNYISKKCGDVVTNACPCHLNLYATNVSNTYVCSYGGRATVSMLLLLTLCWLQVE